LIHFYKRIKYAAEFDSAENLVKRRKCTIS